jgi:aryl-alcohol dehydrogenase-like predicted oxidoreductase
VRKLLDERKMSFVAFSPLAQGLVTGKYTSKNPPSFPDGDHRNQHPKFSAEALSRLEPKLERLKSRFGNREEDLVRAALQYLLSFKAVACVIPGFRNQAQVEMNVRAARKPLTQEDVNFIRGVFEEEGTFAFI